MLEWLKHRATNQIHYDSRAKVIYDKINAIGKPEPEVDWCKLWHEKVARDQSNQFVLSVSWDYSDHFCLRIPPVINADVGPVFSGKTYQDCYRQACKWASIEAEVQ